MKSRKKQEDRSSIFTRAIVSREGVGLTASVLQRNDLLFHTFVTDVPAFIFLRRGKKTLTIRGKKIVLRPGDAVAIASGATCDVLNETDRGQFESTWIVCSGQTLDAAEKRHLKKRTLSEAVGLKGLGQEFANPFERAVTSITDKSIPNAIAEYRVGEVLTWLAECGYVFQMEELNDVRSRVRRMIGADPQKNWVSKDVANAFAMSEATFRRRLSESGQSFNDILVDVRMASALTMLQVTDTSISEIAYQVGYESASRFSVRFKKRFGFSPNAVRGVSIEK